MLRMDVASEELVAPGTSHVIDALFMAGSLPHAPTAVVWGSVLHISAALSVSPGVWVLLTINDGCTYLAQVMTFFSIHDVIFLHAQPYPFADVSLDQKYTSWKITTAQLKSPVLQEASVPLENIVEITRVHRFSVSEKETHFIKM